MYFPSLFTKTKNKWICSSSTWNQLQNVKCHRPKQLWYEACFPRTFTNKLFFSSFKSSTVCVTRPWNSLFFTCAQLEWFFSCFSPHAGGIWEPSWCQNQEISGLGFEEPEWEKRGNSLLQGTGTSLSTLLVCLNVSYWLSNCALSIYLSFNLTSSMFTCNYDQSCLSHCLLIPSYLSISHWSKYNTMFFSRKSWGHLIFRDSKAVVNWVRNGSCVAESSVWC